MQVNVVNFGNALKLQLLRCRLFDAGDIKTTSSCNYDSYEGQRILGGGKLLSASQFIESRFRFRTGLPYYEYIKQYVADVTQEYYKYWVWYDSGTDLPDGLRRIYWHMRNDNLLSYAGKTYQVVDDRMKTGKRKLELVPIVEDGNFSGILWGYINEDDGHSDPEWFDKMHRIFEDAFIHILSRIAQEQCNNRFIPAIYSFKWTTYSTDWLTDNI